MRRMCLLYRCYLLLLLLAAIVQQSARAVASMLPAYYDVPLFKLNDLLSGRRLDEFASVLGTTGLLAIRVEDDPVFERVRESALGGLCYCISSDDDNSENNHARFLSIDGTDMAKLSDGLTTRTSFATATMGNMPLPLPDSLKETCGVDMFQEMEALRDHVAYVSNAFVSALDHLLLRTNSMHTPLLQTLDGGSYSSVSSIVKASSNLEHFHVYSKTTDEHHETTSAIIDEALDMHTDAGLFLAFVPGFACHIDGSNIDDSFLVADTDGVTKRAVFPQGSVAIMLGTGSEYWLKQSRPLRATRHAVQMHQGVKKAWYGIMHLVPPSAIVQESPQRRTFGDMRKAMVMTDEQQQRRFGDDPQANIDMAIGCGNDYGQLLDQNNAGPSRPQRTRARLKQVADASVCNNSTNFYCWMSCIDIPDADNAEGFINEGYSLYCLDPSILASSGNQVSKATKPCNKGDVIGGAMNTACRGSWEKTEPGVPSQHVHVKTSTISDNTGEEQLFCYGGTSMYMDGFQWSGTTCIIYLFPKWVLSTAGSVVFASFGTLIFGVALEGIIYSRRSIVQSMPHGWKRLGVSTLIYGMQLTMGYLIMLVIMTYSVPLFVSVILGLMGGHLIFNAQDAMKKRKRKNSEEALTDESTPFGTSNDAEEEQENSVVARSRSSSGYGVPEGSTPCCQNTL